MRIALGFGLSVSLREEWARTDGGGGVEGGVEGVEGGGVGGRGWEMDGTGACAATGTE